MSSWMKYVFKWYCSSLKYFAWYAIIQHHWKNTTDAGTHDSPVIKCIYNKYLTSSSSLVCLSGWLRSSGFFLLLNIILYCITTLCYSVFLYVFNIFILYILLYLELLWFCYPFQKCLICIKNHDLNVFVMMKWAFPFYFWEREWLIKNTSIPLVMMWCHIMCLWLCAS